MELKKKKTTLLSTVEQQLFVLVKNEKCKEKNPF